MYESEELNAIARLVFTEVLSWKPAEQVLHALQTLSDDQEQGLLQILEQLSLGKPVQQILGTAWFQDLKFYVNEHVLIPRPETSELVDKVLADYKGRNSEVLNILDICTGSGCIALSLKKQFPHARIEALDVSAMALEVAKKNAKSLSMAVNFHKADILKAKKAPMIIQWLDEARNSGTRFDLMISNPPYVRRSEMKSMLPRVKDHEPAIALFVEDDDPLVFYREIAGLAEELLAPGGSLYFEINEALAAELFDLLGKFNFESVRIEQDFYGKDRMLICKRRIHAL